MLGLKSYLLKKNSFGKALSVRQVVGRAKKRQLATLAVNTHKCNTTGTACIHAPTNTVKLACTILQCKKAALCHSAIIATRQIHSIALPTFLFSTLHCLENTTNTTEQRKQSLRAKSVRISKPKRLCSSVYLRIAPAALSRFK